MALVTLSLFISLIFSLFLLSLLGSLFTPLASSLVMNYPVFQEKKKESRFRTVASRVEINRNGDQQPIRDITEIFRTVPVPQPASMMQIRSTFTPSKSRKPANTTRRKDRFHSKSAQKGQESKGLGEAALRIDLTWGEVLKLHI